MSEADFSTNFSDYVEVYKTNTEDILYPSQPVCNLSELKDLYDRLQQDYEKLRKKYSTLKNMVKSLTIIINELNNIVI